MKRLLLCLLIAACASHASAHTITQFVSMKADVTDSTSAGVTALDDIGIAVVANTTYVARCYIVTSTDATTTGVFLGIAGPAAATQTSGLMTYFGTTSAATRAVASFNSLAFNLTVTEAPDSPGTTRVVNQVYLVFRNGANNGTLQPRINTEVNTSAVTAHQGSWCEYSYEKP